MRAAQQPDNRTAPNFLHHMLLKEESAPGSMSDIQPAANDGQTNMQVLIELAVIRMHGSA